MLIGPNAPIVFEPIHGNYIANVYDFYKPNLSSEYPVVDGPLTITTYLEALDQSYARYREKLERRINKAGGRVNQAEGELLSESFAYSILHSPYCKLVQKGHARLLYNDFLADPSHPRFSTISDSDKAHILSLPHSASLIDKIIEKTFLALSLSSYTSTVLPGLACAQRCGNMYTGSLYAGIASLLSNVPNEALKGKRVALFAFGGGAAATFFVMKVVGDSDEMARKMDLKGRFERMRVVPCDEYSQALMVRERHHNDLDYRPTGSLDNIWSRSYYVDRIDSHYRDRKSVV